MASAEPPGASAAANLPIPAGPGDVGAGASTAARQRAGHGLAQQQAAPQPPAAPSAASPDVGAVASGPPAAASSAAAASASAAWLSRAATYRAARQRNGPPAKGANKWRPFQLLAAMEKVAENTELPANSQISGRVISKITFLTRWKSRAKKAAAERPFQMAVRVGHLQQLKDISSRSAGHLGAALEQDYMVSHVDMMLKVGLHVSGSGATGALLFRYHTASLGCPYGRKAKGMCMHVCDVWHYEHVCRWFCGGGRWGVGMAVMCASAWR